MTPTLRAVFRLGGQAGTQAIARMVETEVSWLSGPIAEGALNVELGRARGYLAHAGLIERVSVVDSGTGRVRQGEESWRLGPGLRTVELARPARLARLINRWRQRGKDPAVLAALRGWLVEEGVLDPAARLEEVLVRLERVLESSAPHRPIPGSLREHLTTGGTPSRDSLRSRISTAPIPTRLPRDPDIIRVLGPPAHSWETTGSEVDLSTYLRTEVVAEWYALHDEVWEYEPHDGVVRLGARPAAKPQGPDPDRDLALEPPRNRYPDVIVFDGDRTHPHTDPLVSGREYVVEVAVRMEPCGLPADRDGRKPLLEPGSESDLPLWVSAFADPEVVSIPDPLQQLTLPPQGDSHRNARFAVQPRKATGRDEHHFIRFQILYRFNVLAEVMLAVQVRHDPGPRWTKQDALYVSQESSPEAFLDLEVRRARDMAITVIPSSRGWVLQFVLRDPADAERSMLVRAVWNGTEQELEHLLESARDGLQNVMEPDDGLELDEYTGQERLAELARRGADIWGELAWTDAEGSLLQVSTFLDEYAPPRDSFVSISLSHGAEDFAFPWGMLYTAPWPESGATADEEGFWGFRYVIEQRAPKRLPPGERSWNLNPVTIDCFLWESFENAETHVSALRGLEQKTQPPLAFVGPRTTAGKSLEHLRSERSRRVLYFYVHGFTRRLRERDMSEHARQKLRDNLQMVLRLDGKGDEGLEELVETLKGLHRADKTFLTFSRGRLQLGELKREIRTPDHFDRSLVFLNACESAAHTPSSSDGFVEFFLNRGAAAVIGTECRISVDFAPAFAERFFEHVLAGTEFGSALVATRRDLMQRHRNPLGLAYSLYGSAGLQIQPPILIEEEAQP